MVVGHDRTGYELREHSYISSVVYQVLFGFCLASEYVNDVGDVLEGVEADTYGEYDILYGKALVEEMIDVLSAEGPVFEEYQPPEVEKYAEGKPKLLSMPAVLYELPDYEVEQYRQQEKKYIDRLFYAEAVKYHASGEQNEVLVFLPDGGIYYHKNRQEYKYKFQAAEYQIYHPLVNSFVRASAFLFLLRSAENSIIKTHTLLFYTFVN